MRIFLKMLSAAFVALLVFNGMDDLEALLSPMGRVEEIRFFTRTQTTVCYTLQFERYRAGEAKRLTWTVADVTAPLQTAFFTPYDPVNQRMALPNEGTRPGKADLRVRCFDLPPPLQGTQRALVINSYLQYEVWHHGWLVPLHLGPFVVPPMPSPVALQ